MVEGPGINSTSPHRAKKIRGLEDRRLEDERRITGGGREGDKIRESKRL